MSCLRSKFFTRRMTASRARSIIRVDTYHSGMRSFLCGASGWQKWRGMSGLLAANRCEKSQRTKQRNAQGARTKMRCVAVRCLLSAGCDRVSGAYSRNRPSPGLHLSLRSEEHTSELQSQSNLVCRLLLEKKKKN